MTRLAFLLGNVLAASTVLAMGRVYVPKVEAEALRIAGISPAYSATIIAIGAPVKTTRPVKLIIDKVYTGYPETPKAGDIIVRDYTVPPPDADVAWEGITPRVGLKLLILQRTGDAGILAAEPESSPRAAKIRELIQLHKRAASDPKVLVDRAAALQPAAEPLERAYLPTAIVSRVPADVAAEALAGLMEKEGFTSTERMQLAVSFAQAWHAASAAGKARSLQHLAQVAASPDFAKASSPLSELLVIRSQVPDALPSLSPQVAHGLRTNYQKLVALGRTRDPALEAHINHAAGAR
jgi:hypothetical protein